MPFTDFESVGLLKLRSLCLEDHFERTMSSENFAERSQIRQKAVQNYLNFEGMNFFL